MAHRHPVAFDVGDPEGGGVEKQVNEMVPQQVDLVDVEQPAVGGGEQTRAQDADPVGQRPVQIEGTGHPVFGGAHGQFHQPGRTGQ